MKYTQLINRSFRPSFLSSPRLPWKGTLGSSLFLLFLLFLLSSLHLVYRTIGSPVKAQDPSLYLDPKTGEERLVDTTIVNGSQIGYPFENMTNNFSSSFSEVLKEKEMIRVGKLEETFTFGIPFNQSFGTLTPGDKPITKGNTITYPKVWGGSDLRYTVSPERLLEEIIVPTREEVGKIGDFTQTLSLGKLTARKNDDGSITILKDNQGVVFTIPKPLLYELNNKKATNDGVVYELLLEAGSTKLTKRVTEEGRRWLTDKRRHYPVVIDAAVTVATSTSANAMGTSFQSKVFFNPGTSNYWSFYYNGSAIAYSSSTDGVTWVARGTLSYNTFHFSISQRDQSNTIFLATQCGTDLDICVLKGTISGTTISWGSEYTALDGTNATTDAYTRPNIALSRMGNIWVAGRKQTAASTFISTVRKSSSVEDPSAWGSTTTVGSSEAYLLDHILIPTTYQNMYMVVNGAGGDKSITGYTYNGTSWASAVTGGEGGGGGSVNTDNYGFGTNATVRALAVSGTTLYIGGEFTIAGGIPANYIAKWDGTSWSALGGGTNNIVYALTISGTDLYAGGNFTVAGGITVNRIAKWNGTSWSALGAGATTASSYVYALAVSGTDLYAGGDFTTAGGVTVNRIAKWNGTSWSALGGGMGSTNSSVSALVFIGTDLYAGGSSSTSGGVTTNYIAKWNGTSWSALGTGMNNSVKALAVIGTDLYAGGAFTTSGGVTTNYIAKWNGTSWSALGGGINNTVWALLVTGTDLYAGGAFTTSGGVTTNYIAKWNGTSWSTVGSATTSWSPFSGTYSLLSLNGAVSATALINSDLYAGGSFTTAVQPDGTISTVNYIAKWNGTSWSALGGGMNTNGYVYSLAVIGTDLYAGGAFTTSGGVTTNRIAKWNGTSWTQVGYGMNNIVYTLAVSGTDLYVGGMFTTSSTSQGSVTTNGIAKWNGTDWWIALGPGLTGGQVNALSFAGSTLNAGGTFTAAGAVTVNYIASWNGTSWSPLTVTGNMIGTSNTVNTAVFIGSNLYIAGTFSTIAGLTVNYIAKWDGTSWSALGNGMNSTVNALAVIGTDLYAGGIFTTSGGVTTNYIAKWNGTSWSALGGGLSYGINSITNSGTDIYAAGSYYISKWNGTSWSEIASVNISPVRVITPIGSDMYIGGNFSKDAGLNITMNYIGKWNGTSWSALGGGMNTNGYVYSLAVIGTDLYVGGAFTTSGGMGTNRIAKWNGTSWSALGGGMNTGIVYSLAASGTDLYAGGSFTTSGGVTTNGMAKWNGTSWSALGGGIGGYTNGALTIAVSGTTIYPGGDFTTANGTALTVNRIAKWNGTSWGTVSGTAPFVGTNSFVSALIADASNNLYVGGAFTTSGTTTTNHIAKWNGTSWSALGPGVGWSTLALAFIGTDLYVGGTGYSNYIAKWNGTSWSQMGTGMNTAVSALTVSGTDLYAGGTFTTSGGVTTNYIAKWNGTSWSALGQAMDGNTVSVIAVIGTDLYAGGNFTKVGGVTVNYIAKWNGTSWSALGGGMNALVSAFAVSGTDLYAGGSFTTSGGVTTNYIAKWNGTSWSALGGGMNNVVTALAVIGTNLYAGGSFTTSDGITTNMIAKWNGTSWSALGSGMGSTSVKALAVSGTDLYAGGGFGTSGGVTTNRIAKWNGTSWSALGGGVYTASSYVWSIAFIGTDLYIGGDFDAVQGGTITVNRIAKWNGTSWSALQTGMSGVNTVNALAVSGTDLYAGGGFTITSGITTNGIARWNGTSWSSVGLGVSGAINTIAISGTSLYTGGSFTTIGNGTLYGRIATLSPISVPSPGGAAAIAASATTAQEITTVSDFSDVTHLLYVDGSSDVKYKKFSSNSWGTAVTLLTGTATNPSISINKANGDLYAFWMEGSTIKYKKGVAPYGSGNWDASPTSYYATGTNATISSGSRWDGVFLQWTNGTGNPYGIMFDKLSAQGSTCYPPPGGAFYVETNCAVTGTVGGADDGDLLITAGQAYTINAGQSTVWGPGKSVTIPTGASIIISNTGSLKQTNMWMVDSDGDGYPASSTITAQTNTPGGTYVRRKNLQTYTATDSNDSDASAH